MPTPLPLSHNDRTRLAKYRIDRFKELDIELLSTAVNLDRTGTLHLNCFNPAFIVSLTKKQQQLATEAHAICGAQHLALWSKGEWVWQIPTQTLPAGCDLPILTLDELESLATDVLETLMATATLERNSTTAASAEPIALPTSNQLPGQSIRAIAEDVEQDLETVREWFGAQNLITIPYGGEEIVRGEDAILAYSHFEPLVIQARMARRGLIAPQSTQNGNGAAASAAEKKTTRRSTTRKPAAAKKTTRAKRSTAAKG
ncbi:hypothetical protein IFO70_10515 [Phormidium tenue FACHB-886]|nr:hypothetical protein [Phormidium tenue FACHB-886]